MSILSALAVLVAGALIAPQALGAEPVAPKSTPPAPVSRNGGKDEKPPTAQDALDFLKLDKVRRICEQTVVLKVDNASADAVVAQVRKALLTAPKTSKIPIEVRRLKSINLTFNSKNSTVAKVLSSTARLGAAQLWLFSDHLLLAPAEALTPAEQETKNKGFATQLGTSRTTESVIQMQKRAAYSSFIANELKGIGLNTTANANTLQDREKRGARSLDPLLANAELGQLSPDAQAMLQELLALTKTSFSEHSGIFSQLSFSPNIPVEIVGGTGSDGGRTRLEAFFTGANNSAWVFEWGTDGHTLSIRGGPQPTTGSAQPTPPKGVSPMDLSAGKS
ncbi:hypothetical protein EON83_22760 [bacterium]|nr:MAG: hypothetical protein EON83_22760 [bacterium]